MPDFQGSDLRPGRERVVHKARSHEEAAAWDREQHLSMTPEQRRSAARVLKLRAFPPDAPDVRACRGDGMNAAHFSPDTWEFIQLLDRHRVDYVVVGGEAVIHYGYVRLTGDVDFFYRNDAANAERLFAALLDFWGGDVPGFDRADELTLPDLVVQFGRPPNRIDLLTAISGVTFQDAWRTRQTLVADDGTPVHLISLGLLIVNKEASARPKDMDDVAFLREAARREGRGD